MGFSRPAVLCLASTLMSCLCLSSVLPKEHFDISEYFSNMSSSSSASVSSCSSMWHVLQKSDHLWHSPGLGFGNIKSKWWCSSSLQAREALPIPDIALHESLHCTIKLRRSACIIHIFETNTFVKLMVSKKTKKMYRTRKPTDDWVNWQNPTLTHETKFIREHTNKSANQTLSSNVTADQFLAHSSPIAH